MKTGLPALSTLVVPLFAMVLPARESTGALLPLLILGDAIAVVIYRRSAEWRSLLRLLPWDSSSMHGSTPSQAMALASRTAGGSRPSREGTYAHEGLQINRHGKRRGLTLSLKVSP